MLTPPVGFNDEIVFGPYKKPIFTCMEFGTLTATVFRVKKISFPIGHDNISKVLAAKWKQPF